MDRDIVVGLIGYPRVGKDELGAALGKHHGFTRVAFGDPIKQLLIKSDPAYQGSLEILEEHKAMGVDKDPLMTRQKLQGLGQSIRDIDSGFWIKAALSFGNIPEEGPIVFTDIRYPNEYEFVLNSPDLPGNRGDARIIGLHRPGHGPINDHPSEIFTGELLKELDLNIENTGTIDDLATAAVELLNSCYIN